MRNPNINLKRGAKFALFVSSYLPLFILIILRQVSNNTEYLYWGGFTSESIWLFISKFNLSILLVSISVFGLLGLKFLMSNLSENVTNGTKVTVTEVRNKNSEAISYIATYIIPFLFQKFDNWFEVAAIIFLLIIIYNIYINSNLLLINPLLNLKYSIYDIEFVDNDKSPKKKSGLLIIKDKYLDEEEIIKIYPIRQKIYFGINQPIEE